MKFLELLPKAEGPGFDVLVSILEEDNYWLGEEMKAGLKEERDELVIEDYIGHLATFVGKTNYGKSLRLTAEDKTKIVFLLEEHIQYAKEVFFKYLKLIYPVEKIINLILQFYFLSIYYISLGKHVAIQLY